MGCSCENLHPSTPQNGPTCENMHFRHTRERIAKICAPPKSYYPRMVHTPQALQIFSAHPRADFFDLSTLETSEARSADSGLARLEITRGSVGAGWGCRSLINDIIRRGPSEECSKTYTPPQPLIYTHNKRSACYQYHKRDTMVSPNCTAVPSCGSADAVAGKANDGMATPVISDVRL